MSGRLCQAVTILPTKEFPHSGVSRLGTSSIRHVMLRLMQFERECRELRVTESTKSRHFHESGKGGGADSSGTRLSASCEGRVSPLQRLRRIPSIGYVFGNLRQSS
jgi:hypothetical protein